VLEKVKKPVISEDMDIVLVKVNKPLEIIFEVVALEKVK